MSNVHVSETLKVRTYLGVKHSRSEGSNRPSPSTAHKYGTVPSTSTCDRYNTNECGYCMEYFVCTLATGGATRAPEEVLSV